MAKYALGLDYGTLSVRALLIDIHTGEEIATSVYEYAHGVMETSIPTGRKLPSAWALQHPQDYIDGLEITVKNVMENSKVDPKDVIGIGVDFTSATVLPTTIDGTPLCQMDDFADEPHAYVKLWKHHGAEEEAQIIDNLTKERGEEWMKLYGGKVSAEWMIPKIYETFRKAPKVYQTAARFVDAGDWIIWLLTGEESHSACYAGYKAFYNHKTGYPSKEFFAAVDPGLENLVEEKMSHGPIKGMGERAGFLTKEMAEKLGLAEGTAVATTIIDAHSSVIGAGISKAGTMMIIVGTSSCHMFLSDKEASVSGIQGLVKDGILPGYFAYEAGQSCVGDHYAWFVKNCVPESYEIEAREKGMGIHQLLTEKLMEYKPGQSGLLALDWFNGVRSPLMDFNLNGLIMGMNLLTKPEEIYLALIEATAYGTRIIIEAFENAGIPIERIVLSGGIPLKNKMLVQIYSDICNKSIQICGSSNASAMGAAILGIAAADEAVTGYKSANEAAEKLGKIEKEIYQPIPEHVSVYNELYAEYKTLHEYFGKGGNDVMKRLNAIRDRQR